MEYRTTEKDFDYFVKQCKVWIEIWGLLDWQLHYSHIECPEVDAYGYCQADLSGRSALIVLTADWDEKPTKERIAYVARHEVLELLVWALFELASNRQGSADRIDSEHHGLIRRIEYVLDHPLRLPRKVIKKK